MWWLCYGEYHGKPDIKRFCRYFLARVNQAERDEIYRLYVCDSLRNIPQEQYIVASYDELIHPEESETEEVNGDEIAFEVMQKAGLRFKEE